MAARDLNAKKVPLFPLLSLVCFTSIFLILSQFRKTSIPSDSRSHHQSFQIAGKGSGNKVRVGSCDYSDGSWIYDPNGRRARYDQTCKEIFKGWNCMLGNKSNAGEIVKWRWKPRRCDLPQFDPVRFLQDYRDTSIGTLLCL